MSKALPMSWCAELNAGELNRCRAFTPGEHFVQFYEKDDFLVNSLAKFIEEGLRKGEGTLLIATAPHRAALEMELSRQGLDLSAARASGQHIDLDAAETLDQFMVDGSPDEALFNKVVGGIIERAGQGGRAVRAFGEMVVLLWNDGNGAAALRLEELWNRIAEIHSFGLFCAYPINGFRDHSSSEAFARICQEHSRVLPSEKYSAFSDGERLREIAILQQKALALEQEIAHRKRTEDELQRRKQQLQAMVENTPNCVKIVASDGTLLSINEAGLAMLEAACAEEVVGKSVYDLIAPEDRDAFVRMNQLVCGGSKAGLEFTVVGLKGTRRWMETQATPLEDPVTGKRVHLAITRDVTYTKRAHEAMERLAAIVQSSDDAIVSKDLNGIIKSWNQGAERIFGYTAEEIIGKSVTTLMPPDRIEEEPRILEHLRQGQRIDHFQTVRRRKDGTLLDVSVTISPIKDRHGNVIGASKVARDISDQVRAQEKLERTVAERTAQLREMVAELEAFSYSVAHDMRAPLRAMNSYARMVEQDFSGALPPQAKQFLRRIAVAAQRLDLLITDALNYSKIARAEFALERVDLEKLTREIVDSYPDLQDSGATILIQSPIPEVLGNQAALTQCISNLLSNAIKFVAPGTKPRVLIRADEKPDSVRLWFEDNGIGISPSGRERIFRLFQRLNPSDKFEGTGIGLTIVRKGVERMGGSIGVESQPGCGSQFWIELKRAP